MVVNNLCPSTSRESSHNRKRHGPIVPVNGMVPPRFELVVEYEPSEFSCTCTCMYLHTVLVEAVKCLCNILLNNRHLASTLDQLGCLSTVTQRLSLCHAHKLPYELIQFDLRLLFLITACGASERCVDLDGSISGVPLHIHRSMVECTPIKSCMLPCC